MEFKSQGRVSREADFTRSVEVAQIFATGITAICRQYSALRHDRNADAEAKGVLGGGNTSTVQKFRCNVDGTKQCMFTETVTQQDASSRIERSVAHGICNQIQR